MNQKLKCHKNDWKIIDELEQWKTNVVIHFNHVFQSNNQLK